MARMSTLSRKLDELHRLAVIKRTPPGVVIVAMFGHPDDETALRLAGNEAERAGWQLEVWPDEMVREFLAREELEAGTVPAIVLRHRLKVDKRGAVQLAETVPFAPARGGRG